MLDGILSRGFSAKCKSLMKTTRSRIDVVRRKPEATQRFLNEDLAKLLSNGLDINAYGRTEEFLAGMNLLWSYDFVEQSCEYIIKQLSKMQKQGECPEECREAVASLMYAAARFSDLPELRELRDTFQQRYGSGIEAFVNQKLIEKMSSKPPPKEKRIQVLQDIASEFSIRWDSRGFERRMAAPAIVAQVDEQRVDIMKQRQGPPIEKNRVRSYEEANIQKRNEGDNNHIPRRKEAVEYREKSLLKNGGSNLRIDEQRVDVVKQRQGPVVEKTRLRSYEEGNIQKRNDGDNHVSRRKEPIEYKEKSHLKNGGSSSQGDDDLLYCGRRVFTESKPSYLVEKVQDNNVHTRHNNGVHNPRAEGLSCEKADTGKTRGNIPYNSFNPDITPNSVKKIVDEGSDRSKGSSGYSLPPPYVKPNQNTPRPPPYVKPEGDKHKISRDSKLDIEEQSVAPAKLENYGHEKELDYPNDKFPLPKPRSLRKKHHKPSSNEEDVGDVKRSSSSSRRKEHSRNKGLQSLFIEEHSVEDDEERMIDKLLVHYSKKPTNFDPEKLRKKSKEGESSHNQRRNGICEVIPLPVRSVSLPHQQSAEEPNKVFARSNTFQEDNQARHVHPKLPNYDDLAARFAALKGR